jgi:hypothetical protein
MPPDEEKMALESSPNSAIRGHVPLDAVGLLSGGEYQPCSSPLASADLNYFMHALDFLHVLHSHRNLFRSLPGMLADDALPLKPPADSSARTPDSQRLARPARMES